MSSPSRFLSAWLAAACLFAGCTTAELYPEIVANAEKGASHQEPSAVVGCRFLRALSVTEKAGYTSRAGIVYDPGIPAITLLQAKAHSVGGDTLEITSSDQSYRSGRSRGQTLSTMTGNAYQCAGLSPEVERATQPAAARPPIPQSQSETLWSTSIDTRSPDGSRIFAARLKAEQPKSTLDVACHEMNPTARLSGGLWIGDSRVRPLEPPYDDRSEVTLDFLGTRTVSMSMEVNKACRGFAPDSSARPPTA